MPINAIPFFPPTVTLKPDDSLLDALKLMLYHRSNHAPICDAEGRYLGLVSTNAVLAALIPTSATAEGGLSSLKFVGDGMGLLSAHLRDLDQMKVGSFTIDGVPVLHEGSPILESAQLLAHSTAPLPVVGADGKLLGVISRRALLAYLLAQSGD